MASLDWHSLATLAQLARELAVPAQRLLVRPPRRLSGVWYLCAGSVVNELTGERLVAGSRRARSPIYPGHASLRSVSAVRLLYFDKNTALEFGLLDEVQSGTQDISNRRVETDVADASWLEALAESPVLRLLYQRHGASGWQRWLRELSPVSIARGESIVVPGGETECFYVVQSGVALVDDVTGRQARPLACVFAGGFFGEDAVLTGQPRSARVHMPFGGRVLRGNGEQLRGLVADVWWALARNPEPLRYSGPLLQIDGAQTTRSLREQLDTLCKGKCEGKTETYALCAAENCAMLNLAVLLLMHRGFRLVLRETPVVQRDVEVSPSTSVMQTL